MAEINDDTIQYLANLCRIACTDEEKKGILKDLNQILGYVEHLNSVPTDCVQPLSSLVQGEDGLLLREDVEEPPLSKEGFLQAAPSHIAGLIKVPSIMEE